MMQFCRNDGLIGSAYFHRVLECRHVKQTYLHFIGLCKNALPTRFIQVVNFKSHGIGTGCKRNSKIRHDGRIQHLFNVHAEIEFSQEKRPSGQAGHLHHPQVNGFQLGDHLHGIGTIVPLDPERTRNLVIVPGGPSFAVGRQDIKNITDSTPFFKTAVGHLGGKDELYLPGADSFVFCHNLKREWLCERQIQGCSGYYAQKPCSLADGNFWFDCQQ